MRINLEDFAHSFGTTVEDITKLCLDIIRKHDFNYTVIDGEEKDKLILSVLKKIDEDNQVVGSPERKQVWHKGWEENLQDFINSNYDIKKLIPKFIRNNQPVRYNSQYIKTVDPKFEFNFYSVYRQWLFKKYLSGYDYIYEFGCGTGFNLVALAQLHPDKKLYGLDFVSASVDIINKLAEHRGYNMEGHLFDMIYPDEKFKLKKNSVALTIGSIEQLAGKFNKFIEYLLKQPISLCIHVEPMVELYDQNNLIDYLGSKFLNKRGYTKGLLSYLKKLEFGKVIEVLKVKRLFLGSLYMEGYNCIIWRPLKSVARNT